MTGIQDDLATLRADHEKWTVSAAPCPVCDALARVEAEIARLEDDLDRERDNHETLWRYQRDRAEAARLKDGLRRLRELGELWLRVHPDAAVDMESWRQAARARAGMVRDMARDLLADDDAALPRVYAANDWKVETGEMVACPGCAFTFGAEHVTQATGQYDCPVCHAQSKDGGAA